MIITTEYITTKYTRLSKLGHLHEYTRRKTVIVFRCDCCGNIFNRNKGAIDAKRLTNNCYHVCSNCDNKRFAQEKGVEARQLWNMPVSSLKRIGQL